MKKSVIINGQKNCTKCDDIKDLSEFHKDNNSRIGYRGCCKLCFKDYHDKEIQKEYARLWYIENIAPSIKKPRKSYSFILTNGKLECSKCCKIKTLKSFPKAKTKIGVLSKCKICYRKYNKIYKRKIRKNEKLSLSL